ncbi:PspA-associated protein PspAA [Granulicoccus sp. GXG6511]|uniref:PspA-associated protein PspAA n=1 Tax=Granulicoccus sp. GXG6511 TaxID=3381351 RepID=UPI003D7D76AB
MIIRVLNLGQFRFDESHMDDLNACDDAVETAMAARDQEQLTAALRTLIDEIQALGQPLPLDSLEESDLIVPGADATVEEVEALLNGSDSDDGLIPGRAPQA